MLSLAQEPQTPSLWRTLTGAEDSPQQRYSTSCFDRFPVQQPTSETRKQGWHVALMLTICRAPPDCVQWFTGTTGAVKSYNFAGSQLLQSQYYNNCIRTEKGYCGIQWKESSSTSPDPFGVGSTITQVESDGCDALNGFIFIPNLSQDGIQKLPIPVSTTYAYQSQVCGSNFGIEGMGTIAQPLISKS